MSVSNRMYKRSASLPKYRPLSWRVFAWNLLTKDPVLWIALGLAIISTVVVRPPLSAFPEYIDGKTLGCLAALMAASGGLMISGVFDRAAAALVRGCGGVRALTACLVFAVFFSSMFITNDVALIVFVPVTLMVFGKTRRDPAYTVILQTLAANAGSIMLPMGNPQNLYLYSHYGMAFGEFFRTVLPLGVVGGLLLGVLCLRSQGAGEECREVEEEPVVRSRDSWLYGVLFVVAVLSVFDVVDYRLVLGVVVLLMFVKGRLLAQQVDYALLLTFVGFFVFVGNVARVEMVREVLFGIVEPRPFLAAVVSSQVISNVPAAVMLSGFTDHGLALLAGVSAGGFGTLIASMASLISYKLYAQDGGNKKRYLWLFTVLNVLFLIATALAHHAFSR